MKYRNLIAAVAALSTILGIGTASAADMTMPMKAPYSAPPPFSWSGFYIGGNAGAGILLDQGYVNNSFEADRNGFGGLAGGQAGYNWQMGMLVLGIEGEGFWSGMKVTQDTFFGSNPGVLGSTAFIKNRYDFDIAARFGIAIDHALIYGKAGWVDGNFAWSTVEPNNPGFSNNASSSLNGLLIGLGLEYAFANNWSVKFEYDYLGFPSKDVVFNQVSCASCTPFSQTLNVSANKNLFKIGFNYLFNAAPLVARY
jgi:outer membrane immunogenic protein